MMHNTNAPLREISPVTQDADAICVYYQARVVRSQAWFFVAVLRSFDHVAFDRTYDVSESVFEFFVPEAMEPYFIEIMSSLQAHGVVDELHKLSNRLADLTQQV